VSYTVPSSRQLHTKRASDQKDLARASNLKTNYPESNKDKTKARFESKRLTKQGI
jgi:hypothetical protein